MIQQNERFDFIVIGSGAGGAAAAYHLANKGKRVLLLEKGDVLPLDGSTLDVDKVIRQGVFKNKEPWLTKDDKHFVPEEYFNVGGKTKWYGATLLRFSPDEFNADPERQYLPWPISYDDLAPYYSEIEALLGVREFPVEPDLQRIVSRLQRKDTGWRITPLPMGLAPEILQQPNEARHFDGFASVKGLKSDAQRALLDRVAGNNHLKILSGQAVTKLIGMDKSPNQIIGVGVQDGGTFFADRVLLAAGALHSPRLLQRYLETTGLAQQVPCYAQVGRHYKRHILTAMLAVSHKRETDLLRKTALFLNERYPSSSIQPLGFDGELIGTLLPRFVPKWLAQAFGAHAYGFFLQTEEGSDPSNRVIEANGTGYPQLNYDPQRLPLAVREHRQLVRGFRRSLLRAGYMSFTESIPLAGTAHACGTLVAGDDPQRSVVDGRGKVHGMENLFVVDGSVLPRVSRVNPALTIYAWAFRVADLLTGEEQPI